MIFVDRWFWTLLVGMLSIPSTWAQSQGVAPGPPQQPPMPVAPSPNLPLQALQPPANPTGPLLTLADAEARALSRAPRLQAELLRAQSAARAVGVPRSVYFPQLQGNLTAVQANHDSAVSAGAVTTSSISTRAAGGFSLLQMVTDFGRTRDLVRSFRFAAQAAGQNAADVREQILRNVDQAYFSVQAAQSVQQTAQAVLNYRNLSLRQLTALAQSQLRSTVDVQFAAVLVSEAQLAVYRANSDLQAARAQLTAAMGDESDPDYMLRDQALPPPPDNDVTTYINEAFATRPDLKALNLRAQSAHQFALSEKKLYYPTIDIAGTAGEVPEHDSTLKSQYGAVGINVNIPVLNGGLYSSEYGVAKLQAQATDRDVADLRVLIARDVRSVWARTRDAYLQIDVAQRLVAQSTEALRLAQARYDAGLGSIVELNEAQLNQTSALITAAGARYDYMTENTALLYTLGVR
jgi:outer membrane protein